MQQSLSLDFHKFGIAEDELVGQRNMHRRMVHSCMEGKKNCSGESRE
jgi:hypothetical protein